MTQTNIEKQKEIWRPVVGYEDSYEVSSHGRVRSKTKYLSPVKSNGYYVFTLVNPRKNKRAHRLVAAAFLGVSELQVNHKNGDKLDNRVSNLEYCTAKENTIHAHETGLVGCRKGQNNGHSKLSEDQVEDIKSLLDTSLTQKVIAAMFGVSVSTITDIKKGRSWSHV